MTFNPNTFNLPIAEAIPEIKAKLNQQNTLIINAPPGAGKSTLVPLTLLNEPWLQGKKILMLEPRRLAAKTIATRMADMLGEKVGQTVGFRIRFENKTSSETRLEVLTEGILTRMIHSDNTLEGTGLVIFDEFHERSIHADLALAFSREIQQVLRPELRLIIMSATLDMPQLVNLLKAPAVINHGKQYPVTIKYTGEADERLLPEMTARTIINAVRENEGDVLVFLPGQAEILKTESLLCRELPDFRLHPLYGMLPGGKQMSAIMPDRQGRRKVVLATSIAETSLTIEGIKIVVDSGFGRTSKFDPQSGLSRLKTIRIARDSADQRAGRAGRLSPGTCYRMWSLATQERMDAHRMPEIMEADLASLVLDLANWGIEDVNQLTWLNVPPAGTIAQAQELLHQLDALENNKITPHGRKIHALPCHPRIAHMLLEAREMGLLGLATDLAAILEERDPLQGDAGIDINLRIEWLRKIRQQKGKSRKYTKIEKIAASYRQLFEQQVENASFDPFETGILISQAYPERIAFARPGNNAQFQLSNGKYAMANHRDDLAHEPWLAIAHLNARDGLGKIFLASQLNPKDLAPMVKKRENISWDSRNGEIKAVHELRIGSIVLQSLPLPDPDPEKINSAILEAIRKEGENLLTWNKKTNLWQNRVLSLRHWNPAEDWPKVTISALIQDNLDWLKPYLNDVRTEADLSKLPLKDFLPQLLSYDQQKRLEELAPEKIKVPTGSDIRLEYFPDGKPPVLAVRLQEVFGWAETPTINNGKNPVLLHLLSPGFKPVQITTDLKSFWNNIYYEVRKDLKRRYPKHEWPDDPWEAAPIRGVRKKR